MSGARTGRYGGHHPGEFVTIFDRPADRVFGLSPEQIRDMQRPNPSPMVDMATGRGWGVEVTMARHADGSFTVIDERRTEETAP